MSWKNDIITSIQAISGTAAMKYKPSVYYATVNNVDIPSRTCSCTLISGPSDLSLNSVNLMAAVNDGLLRVPSRNSTVYILHVDGAPPWVDMFSQIDQVFYVAGTSTMLLDKSKGIALTALSAGGAPSNGITLNVAPAAGAINYGGIIKDVDPDNPEVGLLKKLNNLENLLNDLIVKFNSHTHVCSDFAVSGGGGGTASGTTETAVPQESQNITTITAAADLENKTVTHGNGN